MQLDASGERSQHVSACCLRPGDDLKDRDRTAGVTLQLLDIFAARSGDRIVAPALRAFDELERAVRLRSTTSGRTPVRMSAMEISLIDADFAAAYADQRTHACGTARLNDVLSFCVHKSHSPTASENDLFEPSSVDPSEPDAWRVAVLASLARVAPL